MLLPYTSPREIDYLGRLIADPFAPTCDRWARRYWATASRQLRRHDAAFQWPRCLRSMLLVTKETVGEGRR